MTQDSFLTVEGPSFAEYKDRGSKFLAYVYPLDNEQKIKQHANELRMKYPDATHVCYAAVWGNNKDMQKSSDDGEPSNTAGKPILRQILSNELTHVAVFVVRYFGGTQLGVPGLISAYGQAAQTALAASIKVERNIECFYRLTYLYEDEGPAFRLMKQMEARILNIRKEAKGLIYFAVKISLRDDLEKAREKYYTLSIENLKHE